MTVATDSSLPDHQANVQVFTAKLEKLFSGPGLASVSSYLCNTHMDVFDKTSKLL